MNSLRKTAITLLEIIRDRIRIWWLQREIVQAKAEKYDALVENMVGLRRALATYKRTIGSIETDLEASRSEVDSIRYEYAALKKRALQNERAATHKERLTLLRKIVPVVVQIPTMQNSISSGASISAKDVLHVLRPLDLILADMGLEKVGEVGQETAFDPTQHHVMETELGSSLSFERVLVKFVGYAFEDEVLVKAEVMGVIERELVEG